jgi:dTDP-glucose 4,6-dehydratase
MTINSHTPKVMLVTGGAGFIGSNFVQYILSSDSQIKVINLDVLSYAGSLRNLTGLEEKFAGRYEFILGDICDTELLEKIFSTKDIDTVVHFAAESHVDRSITGPDIFIQTNIVGTANLLQAARAHWQDRKDVRFHHVSTDEVYGSLGDDGLFQETTPYDPSSPYSASKAASDHLVRAWNRTFGLPVTISNCSNNYGPYQYPEKLLPVLIFNAINNRPLPIYGAGANIRDWLYVLDHCTAIDAVIRRGELGRTYNVGGFNEWKNIDVVKLLCAQLDEILPSGLDGGYESLITFVEDRAGHDMRYAIDASRIKKELGWEPAQTFETGLKATISWYLDNREWLNEIIAENPQVGERLGISE